MSVCLYLVLSEHLGNILPLLYLAVLYERGAPKSELKAVGQKMATGAVGAVVNEQQRIIFKWALKINCVVLLTQSPRCCMVNSEGPGFHCCPVGI